MKGYLLTIFVTVLVSALALATVNYMLDPFRIYHDPIRPMSYSSNERYATAGVINEELYRNRNYDAIIVGTSLSDNTDPAQVSRLFNRKVLKLTISGATPDVQLMATNYALGSEAVRDVFWELNHDFWTGEAFIMNDPALIRRRPDKFFPHYLYDHKLLNDLPYLVSLDPVVQYRKHVSRGPDYDPRKGWYYTDRDKVERQRKLTWLADKGERKRISFLGLIERGCEPVTAHYAAEDALNVAKAHPDVQFTFYMTPYFISSYVQDPCMADQVIAHHEDFLSKASALQNVRFYSFANDEISRQLGKYKDSAHYLPDTNRHMYDVMVSEQPYPALSDMPIFADRLRKHIATYRAYLEKRKAELGTKE